jgi:hypothetical protein
MPFQQGCRPTFGPWLAALLLAGTPGCHPGTSPQGAGTGFGTPQPVVVQDLPLGTDVMEPFISPDGQALFFNDSNAPGRDTDLHLATRSNDLTFKYVGKVAGANGTALDAVASMTATNQLYFISTRGLPADNATLFRGGFDGSGVTAVTVVPVAPPSAQGNLIFDAYVQPDGGALWFSEGDYSSGSLHSSRIVLATPDGLGGFTRAPDSDAILRTVNLASTLVYAPAVSADGLEIFFTRLVQSSASIQVATRSTTSAPFGPAAPIPTITGFAEAPSISPDGKWLYYHWKPNPFDGAPFALRAVSRP